LAATAPAIVEPNSGREQLFDPEFELLLTCCRSGGKSEFADHVSPSLDWERVAESAEHHRLVPLLHASLASQTHAVPFTIRELARTHTWRAIQFTAELSRIARHFDRCGIDFLAYKGPALAEVLYHDFAMRQFGDLDLLVRPKDVARAREALLELGFTTNLSLSDLEEDFYLRTGNEYTFGSGSEPHLVELQWQIVPRFYSIDFDMDALFARSMPITIDGTAVQTPCLEDLMLLLCVHAAKHEWTQLGMLRDIATLAERDLDWKCISEEARRLGIAKITEISLIASSQLFGIELPHGYVVGTRYSDVPQTVNAIIDNLSENREPRTESLQYFQRQARVRERWLDRLRFGWRLATTPSVAEWEMIKLPDTLFPLYRGVRVARLLKRLGN
jgi:hypothetical protein